MLNSMKKLICLLSIMVLIAIYPNTTDGQVGQFTLSIDRSSCTTDDCDVVLTQFTGAYVGWQLHIRCLDSSSSTGWSNWSSWGGGGVYSGSLCGGVL